MKRNQSAATAALAQAIIHIMRLVDLQLLMDVEFDDIQKAVLIAAAKEAIKVSTFMEKSDHGEAEQGLKWIADGMPAE